MRPHLLQPMALVDGNHCTTGSASAPFFFSIAQQKSRNAPECTGLPLFSPYHIIPIIPTKGNNSEPLMYDAGAQASCGAPSCLSTLSQQENERYPPHSLQEKGWCFLYLKKGRASNRSPFEQWICLWVQRMENQTLEWWKAIAGLFSFPTLSTTDVHSWLRETCGNMGVSLGWESQNGWLSYFGLPLKLTKINLPAKKTHLWLKTEPWQVKTKTHTCVTAAAQFSAAPNKNQSRSSLKLESAAFAHFVRISRGVKRFSLPGAAFFQLRKPQKDRFP